MQLCLALDVSGRLKKPILDHTGKATERWTSIHNALEHFVQLGVAWVKYPETQQVLSLYHLMAYGFGFKDTMRELGIRVGSDVTTHQYTEIRMLCKICGAGHALKLTRKPDGEIRANITVIAAKGQHEVSSDVIGWSILSCEGTIQEIERDGNIVVRGDTIIPTPRGI